MRLLTETRILLGAVIALAILFVAIYNSSQKEREDLREALDKAHREIDQLPPQWLIEFAEGVSQKTGVPLNRPGNGEDDAGQ